MGPGKCGKLERQKRRWCLGVGEGQRREEKMGEALWLRRFSGTVKQEVEKEGRNLRGKIPESWRLIVKCLEIPQGS